MSRLLPPWIDGASGAGAMAAPLGSASSATPASTGRVLDFRRRGTPPRRRRRSLLLSLAKPLGVALLTVALPTGLSAWVLSSSRFQLRGVTVQHRSEKTAAAGVQRIPGGWVQQAVLARYAGRNLVRLPLDEVRRHLAANPWIAAVDVAKELPDRLRVTVAERRPVVLLRNGEELYFADAAGRPIAPVGSPAERLAARRQGLLVVGFPRPLPDSREAMVAEPAVAAVSEVAAAARRVSAISGAGTAAETEGAALLEGGPGGTFVTPAVGSAAGVRGIAGALRLAAQLRQLRPGWASAMSAIEVVDEDAEDYQLRIEGLPCPLLVRSSRLAGNLVRFEQLLPELTRRYPALSGVDLRFARRIVVQPATAAPLRPLPQPPRGLQSGAGA